MSRIRLREWSGRRFHDPKVKLIELAAISAFAAVSDAPERVRRLRVPKLKKAREARDAYLFGCGMSAYLGHKVYVSPGETEDCDFITRTTVDDVTYFSCVQLKEWAPEDLGAKGTLDDLLSRFNKGPATDAVLLLRLNRRATIPLADLSQIKVRYSELWFLWSASPDGDKWCLFGDSKASPRLIEFDYPLPKRGAS